MESRSRSKVKGKTSPPRAATVGGTQPVRDAFVDPPSSATGHTGDGRISPRSSSLESGPRRTCRPTASSESASGTRGPAQGAKNDENRVIVGSMSSEKVLNPPQTKAGILHWFPLWNRAHEMLLRQLRIRRVRSRAMPVHVVCQLPVPITAFRRPHK